MKWNQYITELKKKDKTWLPGFARSAIEYIVELKSVEEFWQWTLAHPYITSIIFDLLGYPDLDEGIAPVGVDLSQFEDTLYYRTIDLDGVSFVDKMKISDSNTAIMIYPTAKSDGLELKAIKIPTIKFESTGKSSDGSK